MMTGARVKVRGPDSWHGRLRDRHRAILYGDNHYLHYFGDNLLEKLEAAKSAYLWLPVVRLIGQAKIIMKY